MSNKPGFPPAKASDLRNAMLAADNFARSGVMFIPMPVFSKEEQEHWAKAAIARINKACEDYDNESSEA